MEPTVQVAAIGILATLITTSGVIIVAFINNRKERGGAADSGVEATLRERVAFGEAQITILRQELDRKDGIIERLKAELRAARKNP